MRQRIETILSTEQWDCYHAWHRAYPRKLHEELVMIALLVYQPKGD